MTASRGDGPCSRRGCDCAAPMWYADEDGVYHYFVALLHDRPIATLGTYRWNGMATEIASCPRAERAAYGARPERQPLGGVSDPPRSRTAGSSISLATTGSRRVSMPQPASLMTRA